MAPKSEEEETAPEDPVEVAGRGVASGDAWPGAVSLKDLGWAPASAKKEQVGQEQEEQAKPAPVCTVVPSCKRGGTLARSDSD